MRTGRVLVLESTSKATGEHYPGAWDCADVSVDVHIYQVFYTSFHHMSMRQRLDAACNNKKSLEAIEIGGKWRDLEYETPDDGFNGHRENLRRRTSKFVQAHADAYAGGSGYFFWAAQTEKARTWSFLWLYENGLFPELGTRPTCNRDTLDTCLEPDEM
ncbi:uncharacterized protein EV422DRAFT_570938 [Fimicolochytrium jonesii]|uniref:uncharacterized protein n=1 Tax=Fimicolochytrium jonesii TaxID=1396493 RepID=UPI0022FE05D2|nr:uncharacterized protein EV422DRAFT_570938 [Fimicolochytrium jonesii]KAI8817322.1 hypothetical protein EV422DRAFT_570938 [Fimicolochytrium jonesii]